MEHPVPIPSTTWLPPPRIARFWYRKGVREGGKKILARPRRKSSSAFVAVVRDCKTGSVAPAGLRLTGLYSDTIFTPSLTPLDRLTPPIIAVTSNTRIARSGHREIWCTRWKRGFVLLTCGGPEFPIVQVAVLCSFFLSSHVQIGDKRRRDACQVWSGGYSIIDQCLVLASSAPALLRGYGADRCSAALGFIHIRFTGSPSNSYPSPHPPFSRLPLIPIEISPHLAPQVHTCVIRHNTQLYVVFSSHRYTYELTYERIVWQ